LGINNYYIYSFRDDREKDLSKTKEKRARESAKPRNKKKEY
jgi:hypothetical protein